MADAERERILEQAIRHLANLQQFDPNSIVRADVLGAEMNLGEAVEAVSSLITFYRQIPPDALVRLPNKHLWSVEGRAGSDIELLNRLLTFKAASGANERADLLRQVRAAHHETFEQLHSIVAYLAPVSLTLQDQKQSLARAFDEAKAGIAKANAEADAILEAMRKAAAETGVSRHAHHFKDEADAHVTAARVWLVITWIGAAALIWGAAATLIYRTELDWLRAASGPESAQVALNKALIFGAISFLVVFASRSYMSNRHNVVVNRHRQNALATYAALVKSAGDEGNRDIILTKAAECIFTAQPTGFAKPSGSETPNVSLVSLGQGALSSK